MCAGVVSCCIVLLLIVAVYLQHTKAVERWLRVMEVNIDKVSVCVCVCVCVCACVRVCVCVSMRMLCRWVLKKIIINN